MKRPALPGPVPSNSDAGYWLACRRHELTLCHCGTCGHWHHPPLPLCPACQGTNLEWRLVEGPALLYTWSRVHVAMHASVADFLPYCIAVVEFPSCGGVRLIAWLDHPEVGPPAIGCECELFWLTSDGGQPLPAFRPRSHASAVPSE